jgi:methionyl-tRNA formyltransferase
VKVIIAGKNDIAVDVLKHIIDKMHLPVFVVLNKTDNFKNGFQKSLGYYANKWEIPIVKLEEVYSFENSIFLSLEFDRIIKPVLFNTKNLFNIHFSLLPSYKGMYTSAHPILNGENESGVTLHKMDLGIDTGDIIDQKKINICYKDSARDLHLKYVKVGTELVIKNLCSLLNNTFNFTMQVAEKSTYFSKKSIDYKNLKVDFNQTAFQVSNQLRAYTFREYQLPKFNNIELGSFFITKNKSSFHPGKIIKESDYQIVISTIDFDMILNKDLFYLCCKYSKENDFKSLKKLLNFNKINLEEKTIEGWTPLIIAVYNGSYESAQLLIEAGADVNAHNYNFTSVLMYAKDEFLVNGSLKIIEKLIESNANILSKDIYGKDVVDWVKNKNNYLYKYFKSKL